MNKEKYGKWSGVGKGGKEFYSRTHEKHFAEQ
jgi:hypothetical protein